MHRLAPVPARAGLQLVTVHGPSVPAGALSTCGHPNASPQLCGAELLSPTLT